MINASTMKLCNFKFTDFDLLHIRSEPVAGSVGHAPSDGAIGRFADRLEPGLEVFHSFAGFEKTTYMFYAVAGFIAKFLPLAVVVSWTYTLVACSSNVAGERELGLEAAMRAMGTRNGLQET